MQDRCVLLQTWNETLFASTKNVPRRRTLIFGEPSSSSVENYAWERFESRNAISISIQRGQSFSYLYPYLPIKNWNISVLSRKTERRLICLLIDSLLLKTGHLLTTSIHHNRRHVRILGAADWYLTTSCFLAVQDSSIGDLVSESLIKWLLISACREQCK